MADRSTYYRDNYALYKAHRVCTMCQRDDALPGVRGRDAFATVQLR